MKCPSCEEEMEECYKWQKKGYDAGLDFGVNLSRGHCFLFVLDKNGGFIIE